MVIGPGLHIYYIGTSKKGLCEKGFGGLIEGRLHHIKRERLLLVSCVGTSILLYTVHTMMWVSNGCDHFRGCLDGGQEVGDLSFSLAQICVLGHIGRVDRESLVHWQCGCICRRTIHTLYLLLLARRIAGPKVCRLS